MQRVYPCNLAALNMRPHDFYNDRVEIPLILKFD
jgi:hypothetical protein